MNKPLSLTLHYSDIQALPNVGLRSDAMWRIYVVGELKKAGFSTVPLNEMTDKSVLTGSHEILKSCDGRSITFRQWPLE